jgi:hypothetical protein
MVVERMPGVSLPTGMIASRPPYGRSGAAGETNTWVLYLSLRNDFEWTIRSRSRWNGVRRPQSGSGRSRSAE